MPPLLVAGGGWLSHREGEDLGGLREGSTLRRVLLPNQEMCRSRPQGPGRAGPHAEAQGGENVPLEMCGWVPVTGSSGDLPRCGWGMQRVPSPPGGLEPQAPAEEVALAGFHRGSPGELLA